MNAIRRHLTAIIVGVIVLLVGALVGPRMVIGPQVDVAAVIQQDFVQTVVASGRVETPHRVDMGVQITGVVRRVPVKEGEVVAAGATLIELEASEVHATLDQAQQAVRAASARLRQVREVQSPLAAQVVQQAQLAHDVARDALRRSESLFAAGAIS